MRNTFVDTIINATKKRKDLFLICGDAGLGVFDQFREKSPERFLNLGVAEQNAASFSAGLSLSGFKVYLYNIVPFVLYRCYEQVRNDICYQRLPVVLVGIGSGLTYAPAGMTHYSVEDLGLVQTLPNLQVFSPIDPIEARMVAEYSLNCTAPMYVRLPKRGEPIIHRKNKIDVTKPHVIKDGKKTALIFHGSVSIEAVKAYNILKKNGIEPRLISLPMIQPLNIRGLISLLGDIENVITIEEHYVGCGLGSIIAREYAKKRYRWRLFSLGISDKFVHEIKDTDGMRKHFGISADKIAEFIRRIYEKKR